MPNFNPQAARDKANEGIPPADYLLAVVDMEFSVSKKGQRYTRLKVQVIAGAAKKKSWKEFQGLDVENEMTAGRLGRLLDACGWTGEIDTDDEEALRAAIVGKPFKARVGRRQNGEYINNSLDRFLGGLRSNLLTEGERDAMEAWVVDREAAGDFDRPASGGGGGVGYDDAPPPGDEDIPFASCALAHEPSQIARVLR